MNPRLFIIAICCGLASQLGCSRDQSAAPSSTFSKPAKSAEAAAEFAAGLANDQCESKYRKRPFKADQHQAVLRDGTYSWGGLDVGAPGGFSALVTFREDGTAPHVEVYFSSDALAAPRLH